MIDMDIDLPVPIEFNVPRDVMQRVGKSIVKAHNHRIRDRQETVSGAQLSPNAESWEEAKITGNTPEPAEGFTPGLYTGAMTRETSWNIEAKDNEAVMNLTGPGREHAQSFIDQAREKGKNWDEAFGIGDQERAAAMSEMSKFLKNLYRTAFGG